ncbi:MAG TPA: hypothetical protein VMI75_06750 [Polyangiaceae bacterium]|nr:hypothetical protein [Polyangiaceae bacterium]
MRMVLVVAAMVAVPAFFGCSSAPLKVAGTACGADADCAAGLTCRALGAFTDAGCTTGATVTRRASTGAGARRAAR